MCIIGALLWSCLGGNHKILSGLMFIELPFESRNKREFVPQELPQYGWRIPVDQSGLLPKPLGKILARQKRTSKNRKHPRKVSLLRAGGRGGGVNRGGFPIWTLCLFLSLFIFFCDFSDFSGIFPTGPFPCSRPINLRLKVPTRNSPERFRHTMGLDLSPQNWEPPSLDNLRFTFSQACV